MPLGAEEAALAQVLPRQCENDLFPIFLFRYVNAALEIGKALSTTATDKTLKSTYAEVSPISNQIPNVAKLSPL